MVSRTVVGEVRAIDGTHGVYRTSIPRRCRRAGSVPASK